VIKWFDKHKVGDNNFEVGDLVLKWDRVNEPKGKHTKFQNLCLNSYQITENMGVGKYKLQSLKGELDSLLDNGQILKQCLT